MIDIDLDFALPRDPSAAALARRELRRRFAGGLPDPILDDLYLVVSELVTNAVVHGQGAIRLRLHVDAGEVWGEVIDAGGGFEYALREAGPTAPSGRGLLIVDRLTTRWGVHEGTTHVWFEMLMGSRGRQGAGPHVGEESRPGQLTEGATDPAPPRPPPAEMTRPGAT
jgi:anti-sigma regulatory factor (Ser/Thr protein kinase)